MRAFFYDTWAFVALADARDPHHPDAVHADQELERLGYVAVTSDYVLDETMTLLNAAGGAKVAVAMATDLFARAEGRELLLLDVTPGRRREAFALFEKLAPADRRLSFTDCTSFALMRELGCHVAFTADRHFHRAGKGIRPLFEPRPGGLALVLPRD